MAYEFVRTQNIDISGASEYWASLGRSVSYTYRFALSEYYDASLNKTRLYLASVQLKANINENASIWGRVKLNGTVLGSYAPVSKTTVSGSFVTIASNGGYIEVAHNAYGAAPAVTLGFAQASGTPNTVGSNFGFSPATGVVVGFSVSTTRSVSLQTHPRASSIASCPGTAETNAAFSLAVTRNSASFRHRAVFRAGAATLYTSDPFESSLSFTVPRSWFSNVPNDTAITVAVSVQTYTDESCTTTVGAAAEASVTVIADAGMKPAVTSGWAALSAYNTGTAAASISGYVRGFSRAQASFDESKVSHATGASLASFSVTCLGQTAAASPYRTPVLNAASVTAVCTVTDTRGRTASESFTLAVMDYAAPTLSGVSIFRCGSGGAAAEDGTYYAVSCTAQISSLGGQNSCTPRCAIMAAGGSYGSETALTNGAQSVLGPISADQSYTVRITAEDSLGQTAVFYKTLPTRRWAMKFRANGSGVAFGKAAETDNCLEIAPGWTVKGQGFFDAIYPVGSIYLSVSSASPASLFGGTWQQIKDTFLLAAGASYAAGSSGGEAAHTLTVDELPAHSHTLSMASTDASNASYARYAYSTNINAKTGVIGSTGGGAAHNNMPPYLAVYAWKRTA